MYINNSRNYYFNLNINLNKIEKRIQIFQKKIYKASLACVTHLIDQNQNHFLCEKDFYLVFIQKIILIFKKKIKISNIYYQKLLIMMYFIIRKNYKTYYHGIQLIKYKIAQYSLFLLLKPEWEARYESFSYIYQSHEYTRIIKNHITVLFCTYSFTKNIYSLKIKTQLNCKHINNKQIIQKLDNDSFKSNVLNIWLNQQNFENKNMLNTYLVQSINNQDNFSDFLDTIIYIGLEWYIYINLKIKFIYSKILISKQKESLLFVSINYIINLLLKNVANFLNLIDINLKFVKCIIYKYINHFIILDDFHIKIQNKVNLVVKISQQSITLINYAIRHKLYHKNRRGYWRANHYLHSTQAIFLIREILSNWYEYYHHIIDNQEEILINNTIDKLFYAWQMKK